MVAGFLSQQIYSILMKADNDRCSLVVPTDDSYLIRGISQVVNNILLSPSLQQGLDSINLSLAGGHVQWGIPQCVYGMEIGTILYEQVNLTAMTVLGRLVELGIAVAIDNIHFTVAHEEVVTGDDVTHNGSVVQWGKTL
jgi:hypothetical protein